MSLADQIIEHGPFEPGRIIPGALEGLLYADDLNELREELLAARRARDQERFVVDAVAWNYDGATLVIRCTRCDWRAEIEQPDYGFEPTTLAGLLQRAGEHAEVCG